MGAARERIDGAAATACVGGTATYAATEAWPRSEDMGSTQELDAAELEALYRTHAPSVVRALRRLLPSAAVDDCAQEVFLVARRRFHERRGLSVRAWLIGIARRVAADHRRSRDRSSRRELDHAIPPWDAGTPERVAAAREGLAFVESFLESLPAGSREVFVLARIEGLSAPEIGELLSLNVNTVYTRLHRAGREFQAAVKARKAS
jgi:RNA polymerase sigma-70 factor (ECF subfamily)